MSGWKARPTTYKGIQMRSRLEAGFAAWLDGISDRWEYEPRAFAGDGGQYLPDFSFQVMTKDGERTAYVETKPTEQDATGAITRMTIIWESEPASVLLLAWPGLTAPGGHPCFLRVSDELIAYHTLVLRGPGMPTIGPPAAQMWPDRYWDGQ